MNQKLIPFKAVKGLYTTQSRSKLMARVKSKNTKADMLLRKSLWSLGVRYRIHNKQLPGTPDIVINKGKIAIFVDGEFWHGHNWERAQQQIKTNRAFWISKIETNMERDISNTLKLNSMGYRVFRFWEKEVKRDLSACLNEVLSYIQTQSEEIEN